jgi:hypothetical protein
VLGQTVPVIEHHVLAVVQRILLPWNGNASQRGALPCVQLQAEGTNAFASRTTRPPRHVAITTKQPLENLPGGGTCIAALVASILVSRQDCPCGRHSVSMLNRLCKFG